MSSGPVQDPARQQGTGQPQNRRNKRKCHGSLPAVTGLVRIIVPVKRVQVDTAAAVLVGDIVYEQAEGYDLVHVYQQPFRGDMGRGKEYPKDEHDKVESKRVDGPSKRDQEEQREEYSETGDDFGIDHALFGENVGLIAVLEVVSNLGEAISILEGMARGWTQLTIPATTTAEASSNVRSTMLIRRETTGIVDGLWGVIVAQERREEEAKAPSA